MYTNFRVLHWYNLLISHVGIHGQRRLTEALVKGSLVRKKEYPTKSSPQAKKGLSYRARVWTSMEEDLLEVEEDLPLRKISTQQAESLEAPFTEEEVERVIRTMPGDKAPGPDGMT
ncbi:hypothetical protein Taro_026247, partial [Colocasia esculenta]|nr:hypothetical protein [Colocasia esculenta]